MSLVRSLATAALLVGLSLPGLAHSQEEGAAKVPLKRVVMFSSGVSFYERNGEVEGNTTVDLRFNTGDINDLLKSMVLQDEGGGQISSVSYGSKDPITRTLATFSIDLTSNPTLADLLDQVRGEKVEIQSTNAVSGIILGVEKRRKEVGEDKTVEVAYLNLLTDEGLRSIPLEGVGLIKLANPKLDAQLRQALMVLAMGNSKDKKSVELKFTGEGKRPVRVGYIQESPIWKTSYRLVLSDEKPLLQGWAIVENTTEEDWNDVGLTLVSGRPISFTMDLYQPLFIDRPEVKPELFASLRPRTYDQDLAESEQEFREAAGGEMLQRKAAEKQELAGGSRARRAMAADRAPASAAVLQAERGHLARNIAEARSLFDATQGVQSVAQGGDVGELFQYRIATPVTLARQKSAMLPIVNDSVTGEKVSIYNANVHAKHPLNGLKLKNTTDLHLMQGPITVFDDGAYAGDAQIQDLPPGSERLVSYAMDLDTEIAPSMEGVPEHLLSVRLIKGNLEAKRKLGRKQSYVIKTSGKKEKSVLIEYPIVQGWELIEPKEAGEKTRDLYRFNVKAEPGKPANLTVREEQTVSQQYGLSNLDHNQILYFISAKVVSDEVKAALQDVVKRKAALAALAAKRADLEKQVQVIFEEQNRIRQNMAQLPKESDLFRRYVTKFDEQEDKVEGLRQDIQAAQAEEQKSRESLDKYLSDLDLS
jgi:hypothetical protein